MKFYPRVLTPIVLSLLFISCGEDPELVKRHGEQEAEIAKLRGELALVQERLKNLPDDHSSELEKVVMESKKLETERKHLTEEVSSLEAEQKVLQEKYEAYQRKYAIN